MPLRKNVILVGPPRVGKTTVIQKTIALLRYRCGGFYTQAADKRYHTNFRMVTIDGRDRTATDIDLFRRMDVGVAFNKAALEDAGARAVRQAMGRHRVVVIDQLGHWELESGVFQDVVGEVLDSPHCLLATATTSNHPFLERLKNRPDVIVFRVSEANRSFVAHEIGNHIRGVLDGAQVTGADGSADLEIAVDEVDLSGQVLGSEDS